jgi:hypothetical protein
MILVRYFLTDDAAKRGCASFAKTMTGRCSSPWQSNTKYGCPCDASGRTQQEYEDMTNHLFFHLPLPTLMKTGKSAYFIKIGVRFLVVYTVSILLCFHETKNVGLLSW